MGCSVSIKEFRIGILNTLTKIDETSVMFYHFVSLLTHNYHTFGVGAEPFGNIVVFRLEICYLTPVICQVHGRNLITH